MEEQTFLRLSFEATIRYGLLALGGAVVAAMVYGNRAAIVLALLACGAAYLAQLCATMNVLRLALPAQLASIGCFLAAVVGIGGGY
jgi:hypothetical protein